VEDREKNICLSFARALREGSLYSFFRNGDRGLKPDFTQSVVFWVRFCPHKKEHKEEKGCPV
jgi:hypothetical protein